MGKSGQRVAIIDGNEAVARVAYKLNEVVAIYPITPASPMGEHADAWAARDMPNLFGDVPRVIEMQSEGGAAGAVHGALQTGALTTTFTASQGLLLMLPNMFKIAGELTPMVLHVAARTVAAHALSIFGDHSDVMAARMTGFGMLASASPQEAHDMAAIAQMASLQSRVPFLHFFDGFRTSHELSRVELLSDDELHALIPLDAIDAHRRRALTPDAPVVRGTSQNPDVFFQSREAVNPFYEATSQHVLSAMTRFGEVTGRQYRPYDYFGDPEAERVVMLMGSGAEAARQTVETMVGRGEKVGALVVRMFRPFDGQLLRESIPPSVKSLAVLDRTKEPGALGEPLYLETLAALHEQAAIEPVPELILGGRYGLSSKEFTPPMIKGVFDHLASEAPKNHFTVGIVDDVTHHSIGADEDFVTENPAGLQQALFYGLGSDGTVGANKNSIKIIGEETEFFAQGYFVYDSKKSGAVTISHLRFSPEPIRATYLLEQASFVACHQWQLLERFDVLAKATEGATFLLNSPYGKDEVFAKLPREVQEQILDKQIHLHVIDAHAVAREVGMKRRINTIMQTCFFALSGVLPRDEAIAKIKEKIRTTYGAKGDSVVKLNLDAVDSTLAHLEEVDVPSAPTGDIHRPPTVSPAAPDFVQKVTAAILAGQGDMLPVSAFPPDGTWPTATSQWEKRGIALEAPVWDADLCIQCNKCAFVCPHAAIRTKVYAEEELSGAPESFLSTSYRGKEFEGARKYTVQLAPDDCTGCGVCVQACPAKDKSNPKHKAIDMQPLAPAGEPPREAERENYGFFLAIPEAPRDQVPANFKGSQLLQPLFEYSGACSGCGETPYVKLLSQLFGDRALIANATGCSSIYGGNLPTTPYAVDAHGRGPAWSNSLFEDNAEFGMGFRVALDQRRVRAQLLLTRLGAQVGGELTDALLGALTDEDQRDEASIAAQRERVRLLRAQLKALDTREARELELLADDLVRKSVWIVGGDGWAYDIGFGGLDHALASGLDINILVLDTEVYSNTGGQQSKATPRAAVAKFAAEGKGQAKKDLGMLAIAYRNVYVGRVAFGAKDTQTHKAFLEAEAWHGPSIILAYSPCIAHGYDLVHGLDQQKLAVDTGYWPLYRYDPRKADEQGDGALTLDSRKKKLGLDKFVYNETRFRMLLRSDPERAKRLLSEAQHDVDETFHALERLAGKV